MRFWRGELSLGEAFWFWWFVPFLLLGIGIDALTPFYLGILRRLPTLAENVNAIAVSKIVFTFPSIAWLVFGTVGIVRTVRKPPPKRFWGYAVGVIVLLTNIELSINVARTFLRGSSEGALEDATRSMNANLPYKVDEFTVVTKVELIDGFVVQHHELVFEQPMIVDYDGLKARIIPTACGLFSKELRSGTLKGMEYIYIWKHNTHGQFEIVASDCDASERR